ncbi:MAG: phosphatase PAP2 family protein [Pseudomonadota bacterium]
MNTTVLRVGRGRLAAHLEETRRAIIAGLRPHALLYATAIAALLVAFIAAVHIDRVFEMDMVLLFSLPVFLVIIAAAMSFVVRESFRLWWTGYQGSPIKEVARLFVHDALAPQRLANLLHVFIILSVFMSAFNTLKIFLPAMNPFQWDSTFMEWDKAVHFGVHPYQILQPLLGHPLISFGLNLFYNLWYFVMFSIWIWQATAKEDSEVRQRFLVAFMITWFLGTNVLGTIFSSVGPTFYGRLLGGPDPYLPLMTYLRETTQVLPLWSLDTQNLLWESYISGNSMIAGISAMPSMHVGSSVLLAIVAFAAGKRRLGWCLGIFAVLIFLGSIHLAWHYAIDGYAGIAVALVGWHVAGRLVRWDRARQGLTED